MGGRFVLIGEHQSCAQRRLIFSTVTGAIPCEVMSNGFDLRRFGRQVPKQVVPSWLTDDDGTFEAFARAQWRLSRRRGWSAMGGAIAETMAATQGCAMPKSGHDLNQVNAGKALERAWARYADGYVEGSAQLRSDAHYALEGGYLTDKEIAASCPSEWSSLSLPALPRGADLQGARLGDVRQLWKCLSDLAGWSLEMTDAVRDRVQVSDARADDLQQRFRHLAVVGFRELNAADKVNWSIDRVHMSVRVINFSLDDSTGLEIN